MAMSQPCAACNEITSFICAAQYIHDKESLILCKECYDQGFRCYTILSKLTVSQTPPKDSLPTRIYWDEAGYVTNTDGSDWTYFDK